MVRYFARGLIRTYQILLSPILGQQCRFYPSCSQYALDVIDQYGVCVGTGLAVVRILKCQPWHPGGFDPPPQERITNFDG
jgi:hypothetical protein